MRPAFPALALTFLVVAILAAAGCSGNGDADDRLGPPPALAGKYKGDPAVADVLELDPVSAGRLSVRSETPELDQLSGGDFGQVWLNSEGLSVFLGADSQDRIFDLMSRTPGTRHSGTLILDGEPLCQVWLTYAGSDCDSNPQISYQLRDADAVFRRLESELAGD